MPARGAEVLSGAFHTSFFASVLAALVVLLVTSPADTSLRPFSAIALGGLLTLIIEVVAVATDKADLLNRLDDD